MKTGCLTVLAVVLAAALFGVLDKVFYPDGLMLAMDIATLAVLLLALESLKRENPIP